MCLLYIGLQEKEIITAAIKVDVLVVSAVLYCF